MVLGRLRSARRRWYLSGVLGLVACGEGPAVQRELPGERAEPIAGGEIDADHVNVFALLARHRISEDRYAFSSCTATLIAPNLLLTARHCVSETRDEFVVCGQASLGRLYQAEDLIASNPVFIQQEARWFRGDSIHVPSEGNDTCGFDVALVILSENVPPSVAEPAIPRIDRAVEAGERYVAVGYGVDENGGGGSRQVRRDLYVACSPGSCGRRARDNEFIGDTGVCSGDSGGPAFDSAGKLVGIVSRGAEDCTYPIYGDVASWRDLVVSVATEAALRGGYEAPFWVTSGVSDPPEPVVVEPGAQCGAGFVCPDGYACHASTCTRVCEGDEDCEDGLSCQGEADAPALCLPEQPGTPEAEAARPPDPTCAYRAAVPGRSGAVAWLAAGLVGWLAAGRRQRGRRVSSRD